MPCLHSIVSLVVLLFSYPVKPVVARSDTGKDLFSLAPLSQAIDNATLLELNHSSAVCGLNVKEPGDKARYFGLFNRDVKCLVAINKSTVSCKTDQICCTSGTVPWCCPDDNGCGPSKAAGCTWQVKTVWSTNFVTATTTVTSNHVVSVPGSTDYSTVESTTTTVITESNVDTATDITFVTVTANAKRDARWLLRTPVVAHTTPLLAPSTTANARLSGQKQAISEPPPHITEAPRLEIRGMIWRRTVTTKTVIKTTTKTTYTTLPIEVTSSKYYVVSKITTSVVVQTITSAVNAKTTVKTTSTITQPAPETVVSVASASNQDETGSQQPSSTGEADPQQTTSNPTAFAARGNSGLSKGAQAGIGVGTGIGSLLICLVLGFWLYRRRKNRQEEIQADATTTAVAASQSPGTKQPMVAAPAMAPKDGFYGGGTSSPPPASERYSDIVPVYHSGTSSPAPQYPTSGRFSTHTPTGFEMSASPAPAAAQPTYQYPRPPDPAQGGIRTPQSPVEMHHPVPAEIPSVFSPRPNYAAAQGVPGQGPAYPGHVPYEPGPRPYYER